MSDVRTGRLLLQSPVVFPPPRLGHPPFFKARPWWGPPHPNFMPPHGPPVAMNHGPPHNSVHGPHHQQHNANYPPSQGAENSAGGPTLGDGGPQNFSSSNPPSHSYSAFRNNLRTNPPPMSYSAKRLQAHAHQTTAPSTSEEKESGDKTPPESNEVSAEPTVTEQEEEGEKGEDRGSEMAELEPTPQNSASA